MFSRYTILISLFCRRDFAFFRAFFEWGGMAFSPAVSCLSVFEEDTFALGPYLIATSVGEPRTTVFPLISQMPDQLDPP